LFAVVVAAVFAVVVYAIHEALDRAADGLTLGR